MSRRWCVLTMVAACRFSPQQAASIDAPVIAIGSDADAVSGSDAPPADAPFGAWSLPAMLFTGGDDDDPTLTGDMLELYFNRDADIYTATRSAVTQPWSSPTRVNELSSDSNETTPEITYDGLTIYLSSDRSPSFGGEDIWMSTRPDRQTAWSVPVHVDALSTATDDAASAPSADDLAIVLIAEPDIDDDIYESTRSTTGATWSTPQLLSSIDTPTSNEYSPMLSADQLAIYFDTDRDGIDHLYMATRTTTSVAFDAPVPMTDANTLGEETDPWISPDSRDLFFEHAGSLYEVSR